MSVISLLLSEESEIPDDVYDAALSAITDGALGDAMCDNRDEMSKARAKTSFRGRVLQHVTNNPACSKLTPDQLKSLANSVLDEIVDSYWG